MVDDSNGATTTRKPWTTPTLVFRGTIAEVVRSGGGKLSLVGGDPGEMRCEKPHDPRCS